MTTKLLDLSGKELDAELEKFARAHQKVGWTQKQDYCLQKLLEKGVSISNAAKAVGKSRSSVNRRIAKLKKSGK